MIKDTNPGKQLIGGDFNKLILNSDKKGGKLINQSCFSNFIDMINYCGFIDLGFKGNKYTWLNKIFNKCNALFFERLDRFLAANDWLISYPKIG